MPPRKTPRAKKTTGTPKSARGRKSRSATPRSTRKTAAAAKTPPATVVEEQIIQVQAVEEQVAPALQKPQHTKTQPQIKDLRRKTRSSTPRIMKKKKAIPETQEKLSEGTNSNQSADEAKTGTEEVVSVVQPGAQPELVQKIVQSTKLDSKFSNAGAKSTPQKAPPATAAVENQQMEMDDGSEEADELAPEKDAEVVVLEDASRDKGESAPVQQDFEDQPPSPKVQAKQTVTPQQRKQRLPAWLSPEAGPFLAAASAAALLANAPGSHQKAKGLTPRAPSLPPTPVQAAAAPTLPANATVPAPTVPSAPVQPAAAAAPTLPANATAPANTVAPGSASAPAPAPVILPPPPVCASTPSGELLSLKDAGAASGSLPSEGIEEGELHDPLSAAHLPPPSELSEKQQSTKTLPPWLNPTLGINPMLPGGMVQLGPGIIPQKELAKLAKVERPLLPSGEPDPRAQFFDCRGKTALAALIEFCDKKKLNRPEFEFYAPEPKHGPQIYRATITLCGMKWGWGESPSKAMAKHLAANETLKLLISSYNGTDCVIPGLEAAVYRTQTARKKGLRLTVAGAQGKNDMMEVVGPVPDVVEDLSDGRKDFNYGPVPEWSQWTGLLNTYCQMIGLRMPSFNFETQECRTLAGKTKNEYYCTAEINIDKPVTSEVLDKVGENAIDPSEIAMLEEGFEPKVLKCTAQGTSKKDAQHKVSAQFIAAVLPKCSGLKEACEIINNMKKNKRASVRAKKRERQASRLQKTKAEKRQKMMQNGALEEACSEVDDIDAAIDQTLGDLTYSAGGAILRRAVEDDVQDMYDLIKELATYEKEPDGVKIPLEVLRRDGFGKHKFFYALVAVKGGEKVGYAVFYIAYSTWEGRSVFLEDLYIIQSEQRSGIGKMVLKALAQIATELDCARLDWQALEWNKPALQFYKKIGAKHLADWRNYRLDRQGMASFLSKP